MLFPFGSLAHTFLEFDLFLIFLPFSSFSHSQPVCSFLERGHNQISFVSFSSINAVLDTLFF